MALAEQGTYHIDVAHTDVGFTVRHLVSKVRGKFEDFSGTFVVGETLADSSVHITINPNSINTGNGDRDNHLRSKDFFDIENHPEWTFKSTSVTEHDDHYKVTGDFNLKGVTKPLTMKVEFLGEGPDMEGKNRIGIEGVGEIDRKEYGVDFDIPFEGGVVVGNKINLHVTAEGVRA